MSNSWLEPDVSVEWPEQRRSEKYVLGAPMIAIEVISPGENADYKATVYLKHDAGEVWLVDGRRRRMTVYVRKGREVIRRVERDEYRSEAHWSFPCRKSSERSRIPKSGRRLLGSYR
jgi:Uma2 family endonuclease